MERLQIRSIELDQCRQCRGVWLDHKEVDALFSMDSIPERFINQELYREPPEFVPEGQRKCPRCLVELKTIEVDGIKLDACSDCKGFFADLGELRRLAEAAERRYEESQRAQSAQEQSE